MAVSRAPAAAHDPVGVMMAAVFRHYLDSYIVPRRPNPAKQTRMEADIRRYFRWVLTHMTPLSPSGEGFSAEEFDLLKQRALARKLFGEGKAPKSIATGFSLNSCRARLRRQERRRCS